MPLHDMNIHVFWNHLYIALVIAIACSGFVFLGLVAFFFAFRNAIQNLISLAMFNAIRMSEKFAEKVKSKVIQEYEKENVTGSDAGK